MRSIDQRVFLFRGNRDSVEPLDQAASSVRLRRLQVPWRPTRLNRFPVVSESGQSGIAQANRIALALLCRFDNALRDDFTDQVRLSAVLKAPTRRVERLAHEAGGFVVEIGFVQYERQNSRNVLSPFCRWPRLLLSLVRFSRSVKDVEAVRQFARLVRASQNTELEGKLCADSAIGVPLVCQRFQGAPQHALRS